VPSGTLYAAIPRADGAHVLTPIPEGSNYPVCLSVSSLLLEKPEPSSFIVTYVILANYGLQKCYVL
jgi:hypothetical protein